MEFDTDTNDLDIRTAAVIWSGDQQPEVMVSGCSEFEAIGLFVAAIFGILGMGPGDDTDEDQDD